jgi:hypothetical protein
LNQLDLNYREAADDGIRRAVRHAERLDPGWPLLAYQMLADFCSVRRGCYFTSEDVRRWCSLRGFESPVPKAWGQVFRKAAKAALIRKHGIAVAKERHGSPTVQWEVA